MTIDDGTGLAALMTEVVERFDFVGAVVVSHRGVPIFEGAWGDANAEAGAAFTVDSPIDAGSMAKTFVAAGLWQLHHEDRLSLDRPVKDLVPEISDRSVRVIDLMRHAGGLPELDDPTGMTNTAIAAAVGATSDFPCGSTFRYSNESFDVLALLTERLTGQPWSHFLTERFFGPLDLRSAFIRPPRLVDWHGVRTISYRRTAAGDEAFDMTDDEPFYGSSNIMISVADLARWGHAFAAPTVLDAATIRDGRRQARFTSGELAPMNDLNWYQRSATGPAAFDGHVRGYHSSVYWDPATQLVVAWASNTLGGRPDELLFTRALAHVAEGMPLSDVSELTAATADVPAAAAAGRYRVPGVGIVTLDDVDGILAVSIDGGPPHAGYPVGGFYSPDLGVMIHVPSAADDRSGHLRWITVFDEVDAVRIDDHPDSVLPRAAD